MYTVYSLETLIFDLSTSKLVLELRIICVQLLVNLDYSDRFHSWVKDRQRTDGQTDKQRDRRTYRRCSMRNTVS